MSELYVRHGLEYIADQEAHRYVNGAWLSQTYTCWFRVGTEEYTGTGYYIPLQHDSFPDTRFAQAFVPGTTQSVSSFTFQLTRSSAGNYPGTIYGAIEEADADGLPTGVVIVTTSTDGDTLPSVWTWEQRAFSFSTVELQGGQKYAIVIQFQPVLGWPHSQGFIIG